jgi:predicted transcriptional regulator
MVPVRRDSMNHVILLYLKMKKCYVHKDSIFAFSPQKFSTPHNISRSLNRLTKLGFVSSVDGCYAITDEGIKQLYLIVQNQARTIYNNG